MNPEYVSDKYNRFSFADFNQRNKLWTQKKEAFPLYFTILHFMLFRLVVLHLKNHLNLTYSLQNNIIKCHVNKVHYFVFPNLWWTTPVHPFICLMDKLTFMHWCKGNLNKANCLPRSAFRSHSSSCLKYMLIVFLQ